jgi:hypothetical protein
MIKVATAASSDERLRFCVGIAEDLPFLDHGVDWW